MKSIVVIFLGFFLGNMAVAQNARLQASGDEAFSNKKYYAAAYFYNKALTEGYAGQTKVPLSPAPKFSKEQKVGRYLYTAYRLAESYRLYRDYTQAAQWYAKTLATDKDHQYPLSSLWYGACLHALQQFDESIKQLQVFKANYKGEKRFIDEADREIASCLLAQKQYATAMPVAMIKMAPPLNGGEGDYALTKNGGDYWFTSSRVTHKSDVPVNRVFVSGHQNNFNPMAVDLKYADNEAAEYGTPAFNPAGDKMYVTRWYAKGPKTILGIYSSVYQNGAWSALTKLNKYVNADGFNALQPFVTADGKQLYFVSDRPGGRGGQDIWVSKLDGNGNPVDAVNLGGTINTAFDEQAPFYENTAKKLVFSSTGFKGIGGFDLYESYGQSSGWSAPKNLAYPVNSTKDDLYYFAEQGDTNKFYISSDRASECCLSLFELHFTPVFIVGTILGCDSNKTLQGVTVSLSDSASNNIIEKAETDINGKYRLKGKVNSTYTVTFEKHGYLKKVITLNLKPDKDTLFNPQMCLQQFEVDKPIVIKNILYDFDKASLRPQSKVALDNIAVIMHDNPGVNIEISSHTDSVGNDAYNMALSGRRAASCVAYLVSKGVSKARLSSRGYGETKAVAPNSFANGQDNPAGRQLNRRTEFTVTRYNAN